MRTVADLNGQGLCAQVDPEMFFPTHGEQGTDARRVCALCPVKAECLEIAMAEGVSGIWGGLSHNERRKLGAPGAIHVPELIRRCGTEAGAKRHHRADEPVCGPCAQAQAKAQCVRSARARARRTAA